MKRSTLVRFAAACICLGLGVVAPLLAAQLPATDAANRPAPSEASPSVATPAETRPDDLRAFASRMEKDGYWVAGDGEGLGDAADGFDAGYGYPTNNQPLAVASGYPGRAAGASLPTELTR